MRAFGYEPDDQSETPSALREVTLASTPAEVDRLIRFLTRVRDELARRKPLEPCHFHLRDLDPAWTSADSDLIISAGMTS